MESRDLYVVLNNETKEANFWVGKPLTKNFKRVYLNNLESFCDYLENLPCTKNFVSIWHENTTLLGQELYNMFGYRKYYDSNCLENFPNRILAIMMYGWLMYYTNIFEDIDDEDFVLTYKKTKEQFLFDCFNYMLDED